MKGWTLTLAAIVGLTVLSLASPLAAADEAGKTPLSIETLVNGNLVGSGRASGRVTLDLSSSSDSGKLTFKFSYGNLRRTADGYFRPAKRTETLKGKRGTLVIRSAARQFPVGVLRADGLGEDDEVWTGTWSIVSGTSRYAGLKSGGGVVGIIQPSGHPPTLDYSFRHEGLVTSP